MSNGCHFQLKEQIGLNLSKISHSWSPLTLASSLHPLLHVLFISILALFKARVYTRPAIGIVHPAATASQTWWGRCHSLCMFITCLCVPVAYNSLTVAWRHATCKHPQIDFLFFLSICSCHYHFWKLPRATLWYAARETKYFAYIGAEVYWRCLWLWNWPSTMPRPSPPSHEEKRSSEPIEGVQVCHLHCSNHATPPSW